MVRRALDSRRPSFAFTAVAGFALLAVVLVAVLALRAVTRDAPDPGRRLTRTAVGGTGAELRATFSKDELYVEVAVSRLPALAPGRMYQLWFIPDDEIPRNMGLLLIHPDGVARAQLDIALSDGHILAVTEEPATGSPQPTSSPVVALSI